MSDRDSKIADDKRKVQELINTEEVVKIACDLVDIPSPTGSEKQCADYIIDRYKAAGIKVLPQVFEDGRSNAIGLMKGSGEGPTLMLNGHMDTSFVGDRSGPEEHMPDSPGFLPKAVIDGDWIYGLGVYNMKASLAAFIHAAECIKRAGIELSGDLLIACVAGEIEKSQVDKYQGKQFRGGACGTWYAITHGAVADLAVVGEPSALTLGRAHGGYVWTKITLFGDPMHSAYGTPEKNTINNMLKIANAIQDWGNEYQDRRSVYGMKANVTLSAMEGGWPFRCSRVPIFCNLYIDTRLLPGHQPLEVRREIEQVVEDLRAKDKDLAALRYDITMFMNQWASECSPEEIIWKAVARSHEEVFKAPVEISARPPASDAGELVAHGIPALNYGVSGRTRKRSSGQRQYGKTDWIPSEGEHASITDLVQGTRVYANLILDVCNRTRQELGLHGTGHGRISLGGSAKPIFRGDGGR
ncbi:MAG TPA: M20/M25/M40 family metallo-hydrolase [Usitatibacter sp.]|nr:M20/M25/M40 family metallo-hydrolase [Usitatibacter sp.]